MKKYWKGRENDIDTLLYFIFFGVLLGGRIGYILLYNPLYFLEHPGEILAFWKGGMSFHGGFLGVLLAVFLFSKWKGYSFFKITDILAIIIPVALGLGRIGNYINGELFGFSPYNGPLPMIVDGVSHFPSPLFEMFLEGILLFGIMIYFWRLRASNLELRPSNGFLSSIFLIGYGTMRIIAEQFRIPDAHIGYILGSEHLTMGTIYSIPMVLFGIYLLYRSR